MNYILMNIIIKIIIIIIYKYIMEIAIPLIALGGMYVVSNQQNNTNK